MNTSSAWSFLPIGYAVTVCIELPILLLFLSKQHSLRTRLFAGFWLNACSYPVVVLALPMLLPSRTVYLWVAEIFAPLSECLLFWLAFQPRKTTPENPGVTVRDCVVIVCANLASFGIGEVLYGVGWL
jgi:hypothetical protein